MISTIYLDMDDVLADFSNTYHKVIKIDPRSIQPDQWEDNWKKWIDGENFITQPMLPGAKLLLEFIANLGVKTEILSSTGGPDFYDEIVAQKREWLKRNDIPYHANFCPGKKFKTEFATPHRLLVDDQDGIIVNFRNAGGHGVTHVGNTVDAMEVTILKIDCLLEAHGYQKYGV